MSKKIQKQWFYLGGCIPAALLAFGGACFIVAAAWRWASLTEAIKEWGGIPLVAALFALISLYGCCAVLATAGRAYSRWLEGKR